jgi:hypothetical protein
MEHCPSSPPEIQTRPEFAPHSQLPSRRRRCTCLYKSQNPRSRVDVANCLLVLATDHVDENNTKKYSTNKETKKIKLKSTKLLRGSGGDPVLRMRYPCATTALRRSKVCSTVFAVCTNLKPGQIGKTGSLSVVNGKEKVASTPPVLGLGSSRLVPLVLQAGLPSRELRALLALARTPGPPLSRRLLPPCLLLAPRSVTPWVEGPQSLLARLRLALALVDVRGTQGPSRWST